MLQVAQGRESSVSFVLSAFAAPPDAFLIAQIVISRVVKHGVS